MVSPPPPPPLTTERTVKRPSSLCPDPTLKAPQLWPDVLAEGPRVVKKQCCCGVVPGAGPRVDVDVEVPGADVVTLRARPAHVPHRPLTYPVDCRRAVIRWLLTGSAFPVVLRIGSARGAEKTEIGVTGARRMDVKYIVSTYHSVILPKFLG
ncbi:hypothetical protein PG997_010024 [Apiospora hydei]|uniref:Uncharacterized protein n=1 Tax=Apiospora hydei TaxID=1337664 RepID=A0ABR1VVT6_9PEZI